MPSNRLKWKVCGMRETANIREVAALRPDLMGFIFYPASPRFVGDHLDHSVLGELEGIGKVGVFVDPELEEVLSTKEKYGLDFIQLHGTEEVELVKKLAAEGVQVIKVMAGNQTLEQTTLEAYEPFISHWLFDTRLDKPGGNGVMFDWSRLDTLQLTRPVILSGGIGPEQLNDFMDKLPVSVWGIDINSQVEDAPAMKNTNKISRVKELLDDGK